MTDLETKQATFSFWVVKLILQAHQMGYDVTLGEAWRSDETAALYAKEGKGIAASNHRLRLAIDLNLFQDGELLTSTEAYREFGEWWKAQSSCGYTPCWGGDFSRPDGNHFSFEHNGVR